MKIEPYIFFEGRTEEAIAFYTKAVGAKVEMMLRFSDSPDPVPEQMLPPGGRGKVMHASFTIGESRINASDGHAQREPEYQSFSLAMTVKDPAEAKRAYDALLEGGEVRSPLQKTFFSPCFGMLRDRFGIGWMIMAQA